ncbi:hypothetical protein ABES58_24180 [Paenibacillus lautus]|uniref:hypothetical protein n=1 Tax=Paenibacillus lautus TaxID=1401 RepID=UPI003D269441
MRCFSNSYWIVIRLNRLASAWLLCKDSVAVGTISVKWRSDPDGKGAQPQKQSSSLWKELPKFAKWNTFKMLLGLYTLDYQPRAREYYIADVVVHPEYRG